jgi:hypothetical protein
VDVPPGDLILACHLLVGAQLAALVGLDDLDVVIIDLMREAIRGPSEAIRSALKVHQRSSEAIRGHQRSIRGPSEAIRGHQEAHSEAIIGPSEAISSAPLSLAR